MSLDMSMGGYGDYVWSAYGFVVLLLSGLMIQASAKKKRALQKVKSQLREHNEP
jgi:heme exporter protein CcmD